MWNFDERDAMGRLRGRLERAVITGKGAPVYGEDTQNVLAQAGFSEQEITAFQQEGAVVCAQIASQTGVEG